MPLKILLKREYTIQILLGLIVILYCIFYSPAVNGLNALNGFINFGLAVVWSVLIWLSLIYISLNFSKRNCSQSMQTLNLNPFYMGIGVFLVSFIFVNAASSNIIPSYKN